MSRLNGFTAAVCVNDPMLIAAAPGAPISWCRWAPGVALSMSCLPFRTTGTGPQGRRLPRPDRLHRAVATHKRASSHVPRALTRSVPETGDRQRPFAQRTAQGFATASFGAGQAVRPTDPGYAEDACAAFPHRSRRRDLEFRTRAPSLHLLSPAARSQSSLLVHGGGRCRAIQEIVPGVCKMGLSPLSSKDP